MLYTGLTPIHDLDGYYVKREDLAYWHSLDHPSGSKVRQYMSMAGVVLESNNGMTLIPNMQIHLPCLVPCSANSCMQIYVASTAKLLNTKGIVYTAKRKTKTDATLYAERMGVEINEVEHGYLSNIKKAYRQRAIDLKEQVVKWDRFAAIRDVVAQCKNIPDHIKQIIVPTGSGLTAAGVLIGTKVEVIAVCTSAMADKQSIMELVHMAAKNLGTDPEKRLTVLAPSVPYDTPVVSKLPDSTPLDPFYGAKAWKYINKGMLFWPPGLRPVISMPDMCRRVFQR